MTFLPFPHDDYRDEYELNWKDVNFNFYFDSKEISNQLVEVIFDFDLNFRI